MVRLFILAALLLFSPAGLLAQLRVELSFEQETYLPHEPLFAVVQIYNSSGQTLEFGKDNQWLTFTVEGTESRVVKQFSSADVEGEFMLPSAHRAKKMVNLAKAFDLTKFGRYYVTAIVTVPEWTESFSSPAKFFGISQGVKLWEGVFGIPSESGARPEMRKYQLIQANHLKELSLYLQIVDQAESETLSISPLGPLLGVSRPEAQIDRWSNLHIFYQDGPRSFRYFMVTADGMLLSRETWEIDETRPSLRPGQDGRITVVGGTRRITSSDLPPPELLSEASTGPGQDLPVQEPASSSTKPIRDAAPVSK